MTDTNRGTATTPIGQGWFGRNTWLLAAVWLIFLFFPLRGILTDDSITDEAKVASAVLFVVFGAVYLDGIRRQAQREQRAVVEAENGEADWPGEDTDGATPLRAPGLFHFLALVTLTLVLMVVAGAGAVGVMVFVVVFAVFNFPWPAVAVIFVVGLGVTIAAPLLAGRFADLWPLAMIVAAVGGAAVLVRLFQRYQFDQAHLRTGLAIGDERTRVARDVHDVLGHSVTAAILKVELCRRLLEEVEVDSDESRARLDECRNQLSDLERISRGALAEIRSTVGGLRATDLADEVTAARTVLADAGVELLVTGDMAQIPQRYRPTLAWVVREAVTNVVRHAGAEQCHIELAPGEGREGIMLRVTDDGVGLGAAEEGNGLRGLRERVAASGARVHVESTPGTRIEVSL